MIDDVFVKRTVKFFIDEYIYRNHMEDFYQCGRMAYDRATKKFDRTKMTPFEKYCRVVIRNDLFRMMKKINKSFKEVSIGSLKDFQKLPEFQKMIY